RPKASASPGGGACWNSTAASWWRNGAPTSFPSPRRRAQPPSAGSRKRKTRPETASQAVFRQCASALRLAFGPGVRKRPALLFDGQPLHGFLQLLEGADLDLPHPFPADVVDLAEI